MMQQFVAKNITIFRGTQLVHALKKAGVEDCFTTFFATTAEPEILMVLFLDGGSGSGAVGSAVLAAVLVVYRKQTTLLHTLVPA